MPIYNDPWNGLLKYFSQWCARFVFVQSESQAFQVRVI